MATRVRPVTPDLFERVYPLLADFPGSTMTAEEWRGMLFDLPWPVEEEHRGFALMDDGDVVGFIGTIFSRREIAGARHRFCNLSSWFVRESHRGSSIELLMPVLGMKGYTIVNLTASEVARAILTRVGFRSLEENQWLIPRLPLWRTPSPARAILEPERIGSLLQGEALRIHADMSRTFAAEALIRVGDRVCQAIATSTRWKWGRRLAHVQYASDWDLLLDHAGVASAAFSRRLRTSGLRIDARFVGARGIALARRKALALPTLFRPGGPGIEPTTIDGLYSELVLQPPRLT